MLKALWAVLVILAVRVVWGFGNGTPADDDDLAQRFRINEGGLL